MSGPARSARLPFVTLAGWLSKRWPVPSSTSTVSAFGFNVSEVADILGVNRSVIYRWAREDGLTLLLADRLCRVFGVELWEIWPEVVE